MLGQTINNYIIEHKLGEGGMGNVYFARHNRVDRIVAIKVLHQNLFSNEKIRERFKNEANALIKLTHPNIVRIFDYVEQEDFACLIMEHIEGYTLDDFIAKVSGPLAASRAINIIGGVLDGVQYAHDNNIYHRDIKPGNIMVSKDGKIVRIMDFGIAKFTDGGSLKSTNANAQLGTPFYMSPEQVKGLSYTALSDIYSLGVTFFEMVTGKCPYQAITNLFELQSKIVNEPLPATSVYYPNVPVHLQTAIIKATNKDPGQRFNSCIEFKSFLLEEPKPVAAAFVVPGKKEFLEKNISSSQPVISNAMKEKEAAVLQVLEKPVLKDKKSRTWIVVLLVCGVLLVAGISFVKYNENERQTENPLIAPDASVQKTNSAINTLSKTDSLSIDTSKAIVENSLVKITDTVAGKSDLSTPERNPNLKYLTTSRVLQDLVEKCTSTHAEELNKMSDDEIVFLQFPSKKDQEIDNTIHITLGTKEGKNQVKLIYMKKGNRFEFDDTQSRDITDGSQ